MDSFPEQQALLQRLAECGESGRATVELLVRRQTPIRFRRLPSAAGAIWLLTGEIWLNSRYFSPAQVNHPRLLSLLVHEARHLQQGAAVALSVYGELEAWQVDFQFQNGLTGCSSGPLIERLLALPLALERETLKEARALMRQYAGQGYRVDLLPLFPLAREAAWRLGLGRRR